MQRPSLCMWTSWIFSVASALRVCCMHCRSIKFVSNGKVPIWICCVVCSCWTRPKKSSFFFRECWLGADGGRDGEAFDARTFGQGEINWNEPLVWLYRARHSLWMKICVVFVFFFVFFVFFFWKRRGKTIGIFCSFICCTLSNTHTWCIQKFRLQQHNFDCLFVYSFRCVYVECENWFFTLRLLAAKREPYKNVKENALINFTRNKKPMHSNSDMPRLLWWKKKYRIIWKERKCKRKRICGEKEGLVD